MNAMLFIRNNHIVHFVHARIYLIIMHYATVIMQLVRRYINDRNFKLNFICLMK